VAGSRDRKDFSLHFPEIRWLDRTLKNRGCSREFLRRSSLDLKASEVVGRDKSLFKLHAGGTAPSWAEARHRSGTEPDLDFNECRIDGSDRCPCFAQTHWNF
jgi:hypothetical protein